MGASNQCELILLVPFLDAMASALANSLAVPLGIYSVAQTKYLPDNDHPLHSERIGLAIDLGIDTGAMITINLTKVSPISGWKRVFC